MGKVYVGDLPCSATEQTLRDAFSQSGTVDSASWVSATGHGKCV
jgi:RNA recognition motif-containing protein